MKVNPLPRVNRLREMGFTILLSVDGVRVTYGDSILLDEGVISSRATVAQRDRKKYSTYARMAIAACSNYLKEHPEHDSPKIP